MKKAVEILVFLFLFLLLNAESCSDAGEQYGQEEKAVNAMINDIKESFTVGYLDDDVLVAQENLAVQKLYDMADYLQIMANPSLPEVFRKEVIEMFSKAFLSPDNVITIPAGSANVSHTLPVSQVIDMAEKNEWRVCRFTFDSVQIYQPFQRTGPCSYRGILTFIQNACESQNGKPHLTAIQREAELHIIQKSKIFGSDTLSVWTLFLGDIR